MEAFAGAADAPDIAANPMAIAVATANKITRIFISPFTCTRFFPRNDETRAKRVAMEELSYA
jgi:hypothetical protein